MKQLFITSFCALNFTPLLSQNSNYKWTSTISSAGCKISASVTTDYLRNVNGKLLWAVKSTNSNQALDGTFFNFLKSGALEHQGVINLMR